MYFTLSGSSIPFPSFPRTLDAILSVTVKSRLLRFAAKFICDELQFLSLITVLSWASAHPPILTILWFFMVLRVTATMLNSHVVNPKVQWAHIAAIVLMHFGHHDIRHQRFAHTCPWPRSQRSSPAAWTASDDWSPFPQPAQQLHPGCTMPAADVVNHPCWALKGGYSPHDLALVDHQFSVWNIFLPRATGLWLGTFAMSWQQWYFWICYRFQVPGFCEQCTLAQWYNPGRPETPFCLGL